MKIELVDGFDPLPISSYDEKSFGFQIIKKTVLDLFPEVTVAPGKTANKSDSIQMSAFPRHEIFVSSLEE